MKTGRPRKPTALRLIAGNPGKRAMNTQEPQLAASAVDAPEWLSDAARAHWQRLAPMLIGAGVVRESDRDVLATYCTLFAEFVRASQEGENVPPSKIGQLRQLMGELGMTPSARSRIIADIRKEDGAETKTRFFAAA